MSPSNIFFIAAASDDAQRVQVLAHVLLDLIALEIRGAGARDKDDIIRRGFRDADVGESRSDHSAAAVAPDCFADLFGGGYSDSKVINIFIF